MPPKKRTGRKQASAAVPPPQPPSDPSETPHISSTAPEATVDGSVDLGYGQPGDIVVGDAHDAMDVEQIDLPSRTSTASFASLPPLPGLNGAAPMGGIPVANGGANGATDPFAASSSTSAFPPVASTSQLPLPSMQHTEEEISTWRNAQVDAKQAELAAIVDKHDDYVRELFHLDRFVTLIGFDPAIAKADRSDVFQSFQANYDLFLNAAPGSEAGASGRRGTRRANQERKVVVGANATPGTGGKKDIKGKGRASDSPAASLAGSEEPKFAMDVGGSGRAIVMGGKKKATGGAAARGKKAGSGSPAPGSPAIGSPGSTKMKKRPSQISTPSRASSVIPMGSLPTPYEPVMLKPDAELPPLKHPIPPLTPRIVKRRKLILESGITYTHPTQLPPDPEFDQSLPAFLSSFLSLDEDADIAPPPPESELEARAEYELDILDQVDAIRAEGRELLNPDRTASEEAKRAKDHWESLVDHAIHFSGLVAAEKKSHMAMARKTAKMVMKHFEDIRGKEDKEQKEIERNQKALARWTVREVRKKWKLAIG
ncbi:hypothetical protein JCM11251_005073, partial [Rhodosporidiobolus azoricus]